MLPWALNRGQGSKQAAVLAQRTAADADLSDRAAAAGLLGALKNIGSTG
jgi:hypothetical protein